MRLLAPLLLVSVVGCAKVTFGPDGSGTSVGNPNKSRVTVVIAETQGFQHDHATYPVEALDLVGCEDAPSGWWRLERNLDLLGDELTPVPEFTSCAQVFVPAGNLVVSGSFEGTAYRIELAEPAVRLEGEWEVDPDMDYIVEFPELSMLPFLVDPLTRGESVDYGPDSGFHDFNRALFETGAALYEDPDGDGQLTDQERADGKVSAGEDHRREGC